MFALGLSQAQAQQTSGDLNSGWQRIITYALDRSADQNNGKPAISQDCQPEFKLCKRTISYSTGRLEFGDLENYTVNETKEASGNVVDRDVCEYSAGSDIRTCTNWDTQVRTTEKKHWNGQWTVENQEYVDRNVLLPPPLLH